MAGFCFSWLPGRCLQLSQTPTKQSQEGFNAQCCSLCLTLGFFWTPPGTWTPEEKQNPSHAPDFQRCGGCCSRSSSSRGAALWWLQQHPRSWGCRWDHVWLEKAGHEGGVVLWVGGDPALLPTDVLLSPGRVCRAGRADRIALFSHPEMKR